MDFVRIKVKDDFRATKILPGGVRLAPGQEIRIAREDYERIKDDPDIEVVAIETQVEGESVVESIESIEKRYREIIAQKDQTINELQLEIARLKERIAQLESEKEQRISPLTQKAKEIVESHWRRRREIIEGLDPDADRDLIEILYKMLRSEEQTKSIRDDLEILELKLRQGETE